MMDPLYFVSSSRPRLLLVSKVKRFLPVQYQGGVLCEDSSSDSCRPHRTNVLEASDEVLSHFKD